MEFRSDYVIYTKLGSQMLCHPAAWKAHSNILLEKPKDPPNAGIKIEELAGL